MNRRQIFRVYYYVGNDPDPRSFLVNATSAEEVRKAMINEWGDEAEDYEVDETPVMYAPSKRQMWVSNGRFIREDDE